MEKTAVKPAESISTAQRVFVYDDEVFPDTAPHLPVEAVLRHYSATKPELINASIQGPIINSKKQLEYEFKLELGTKG